MMLHEYSALVTFAWCVSYFRFQVYAANALATLTQRNGNIFAAAVAV